MFNQTEGKILPLLAINYLLKNQGYPIILNYLFCAFLVVVVVVVVVIVVE